MKKRVIGFLLVAVIAASFMLPALATPVAVGEAKEPSAEAATEPPVEDGPKYFVFLDGIPQSVEYEIRNGTTYVTVSSFVAMADPQAAVKEENGAVTVSSSSEGQGTFSMTVSLHIPYIVANGRYLYAKDIVTTVNGHVALPIRKLAQIFNLDVDYNAAVHAALLIHVQGRSAYIQSGDSYYNADTLYWLSRIIYEESGNQSLDGMIAVGNVVMNRVNSPEFPNNIYDVLYQKNQFSPASNGVLGRTPNSESVVAAKLVMDGAQVVPTALFFNRAGTNSYASRTRPYVTTIGAHAFYA